MRRNIIFAIATGITVVALTAACSSDIPDSGATSGQDKTLPINLGFDIAGQTRSATQGVAQGATFADGSQMAVFCDSAAHTYQGFSYPAAQHFGAWIFTAKGGVLTSTTSHNYPRHNWQANLYAMNWPGGDANGNFFTEGADYPTSGLTIKTKTTQISDEDLQDADLIYGTLMGQSQTSAKVTITVYHMLAKIQLRLFPDTTAFTANDLADCTVKLLGVPDGYTFDAYKTDATDMTRRSIRGGMITSNATTTEVEISSEIYPTEKRAEYLGTWTEAIVPLKQYVTGDKFLSLTINSGVYKGMTLYYNIGKNLTLESGMEYKFNITVSPDKLTGGFTLEPWSNGQVEIHDGL